MTPQAPTTPDTVVVPLEPTEAMLAAGQAAGDYGDTLKKAWRAMLAARPAATPGGEREALLERLRDIHRRNPSEHAEVCAIIDAVRALSRPAPVAGEADVEDEELPDTPFARTVYRHFTDVHCLNPDEAADSTGQLLDALSKAGLATPTPQPAAARGGERQPTNEEVAALSKGLREGAGITTTAGVLTEAARMMLAAAPALSAKGGS